MRAAARNPGAGPILILQMAKVASVSWYEAIHAALPQREVQHLHFVSLASRAFIAAICDAQPPEQTIAHRNMFRRLGLPRGDLARRLQGDRWCGDPVRIVSGIRDPMARAVSVLQHGADFLGYTELALTPREHGTAENLVGVFRRGWHEALAGTYPGDTFRRFLAFSFGHYRSWFSDELARVFDLDVGAASFDRDCWAMRTSAGPHAALIYRVEDLRVPDRRIRLLEAASEFVGAKLSDLPTANAAEGRRSRDLYKAFGERAALPASTIDKIYDAPVLRQFYDAAEIEAFKAKWTQTE